MSTQVSDAPAVVLSSWRRKVAGLPEPGVYDEMPSEEYHRSPALSASGMGKILDPGCPALFRYEREHPAPPSKVFDFGHAAHRLVLGAGEEIAIIDAPDYKTDAARSDRDWARGQGLIPMLPEEFAKAKAMADAVRSHPLASALFQGGRPKQSLFWEDPRTGVPLRARLDWLSDKGASRLVVADYKTITAVDLDTIEKSIAKYNYHVQNAQYVEGTTRLGLGGEDTAMVFVFQAKTPPYLVRTVQLDMDTARIGRAKRRAAIDVFRDCMKSGHWPGYDDTTYASLPIWAEKRDEEYL